MRRASEREIERAREMEIEGVECLDGVFPGFFDSLATLKERKR